MTEAHSQNVTCGPIAGGILAGGRSRRMGHEKARLPLADGRAMIEHVAAVVGEVCDRVVILGRCSVVASLPQLDDVHPGAGPLAGLEVLLMRTDAQFALLCPCDLPLISAELLRSLLRLRDADADAAALRLPERRTVESLPACFRRSVLPVVQRQIEQGENSVRALLARLRLHEIDAPQAWAGQLRNINTPQEYEAIRGESQA